MNGKVFYRLEFSLVINHRVCLKILEKCATTLISSSTFEFIVGSEQDFLHREFLLAKMLFRKYNFGQYIPLVYRIIMTIFTKYDI